MTITRQVDPTRDGRLRADAEEESFHLRINPDFPSVPRHSPRVQAGEMADFDDLPRPGPAPTTSPGPGPQHARPTTTKQGRRHHEPLPDPLPVPGRRQPPYPG